MNEKYVPDDKTLNDLYEKFGEIDKEIKVYKKQKLLIEEAEKSRLASANVQIRLEAQHKDDVLNTWVWAVVSGVLGIGLGLLIAWIF